MAEEVSSAAYSGRARRKKTRWSVKFGDLAARVLITVGGVGTIVAVCMVFVFLTAVVIPLFQPPSLAAPAVRPAAWGAIPPLALAIDEYRSMGWALFPDGRLLILRLDDGRVIEQRQLFEGVRCTAVSRSVEGRDLALGFADGTVRLGRIDFKTTFRERQDVPPELHSLTAGQSATWDQGVVQRTPQGQFRWQAIDIQLLEPLQVAEAAIEQLDHLYPVESGTTVGPKEYRCVAYAADGRLAYCLVTEKVNPFLGTTALETQIRELPVPWTGRPAVASLLRVLDRSGRPSGAVRHAEFAAGAGGRAVGSAARYHGPSGAMRLRVGPRDPAVRRHRGRGAGLVPGAAGGRGPGAGAGRRLPPFAGPYIAAGFGRGAFVQCFAAQPNGRGRVC